MWKDSIRNIVVIFQPNILRIVGFYVRHSAISKDSSLYNRTNPCGNHDYLFLMYLCEWELRSKQGNQSVYSLLN